MSWWCSKQKTVSPKCKGSHVSCNILCWYTNTFFSEGHHLVGFLFQFEEDTDMYWLLFSTTLSCISYSKPHTKFYKKIHICWYESVKFLQAQDLTEKELKVLNYSFRRIYTRKRDLLKSWWNMQYFRTSCCFSFSPHFFSKGVCCEFGTRTGVRRGYMF